MTGSPIELAYPTFGQIEPTLTPEDREEAVAQLRMAETHYRLAVEQRREGAPAASPTATAGQVIAHAHPTGQRFADTVNGGAVILDDLAPSQPPSKPRPPAACLATHSALPTLERDAATLCDPATLSAPFGAMSQTRVTVVSEE